VLARLRCVGMSDGEAKNHLSKLAAELRNYGWTAEISEARGLALKVANPATAIMTERVLCRETPGGWEYTWGWR
jgi:hypothetical protein